MKRTPQKIIAKYGGRRLVQTSRSLKLQQRGFGQWRTYEEDWEPADQIKLVRYWNSWADEAHRIDVTAFRRTLGKGR